MIEGLEYPPENLLAARRALDGMKHVTLLDDWEWHEKSSSWILHCKLTLEESQNEFVPKSTNWHVLVDPTYPYGSIEFYPSKKGGLETTFQHQMNNASGSDDRPWRTGNICLHSDTDMPSHYILKEEPINSPKRLKWRFQRALEWLSAASSGKLVKPGDPFEIPHFPITSINNSVVLFNEGQNQFEAWQKIEDSFGLADLITPENRSSPIFVKCFRSVQGIELITPQWGSGPNSMNLSRFQGIWLRVNQPPVKPVWHAPTTWGELREICLSLGINIDSCIKPFRKFLKDSKVALLLIGFPIPSKIDNDPVQMNWQGLELPAFQRPKQGNKRKRAKKKFWERYRDTYLTDESELIWLRMENCHVSQFSSRGKYSDEIVINEVLLIGAGAIGSFLAELLVRGGFKNIIIMDNDLVQAGNLVRHTLGLDSVGLLKSSLVGEKLSLASPHVTVEFIKDNFPPRDKESKARINKCPLILDCTGDDRVIYQLHAYDWPYEKLFVSISVGYKAKRLYFFSSIDSTFPHDDFNKMISGWLESERLMYEKDGFPREGIGCWSPIFPAQVDDIWLLASIAAKHLIEILENPPEKPRLTVFEQKFEKGVFTGVAKTELSSESD